MKKKASPEMANNTNLILEGGFHMMDIISLGNAPSVLGPYSQAIKTDGMVYTSGQIPIDPVTFEIVSGGVEEQTKQALENLKSVLHAAGTDLDKVVKTTVFVRNLSDFERVNKVYKQYFTKEFPAKACVEVRRLPDDINVEIEAIAKA
jgi:2-iminobutanoate/2-iminopropanoate deaminase